MSVRLVLCLRKLCCMKVRGARAVAVALAMKDGHSIWIGYWDALSPPESWCLVDVG